MKTLKHLLILLIAVSATALTALAHDMHTAGSKEGLFGLKPEYLHVLSNPLPTHGLVIGIAILAFGLLRRNQSLKITGLVVTAICAASAWPVLYFGQHGYNDLAPMLDDESHQWLDEHMRRAEQFIYFFYGTAVLAVAALACPKKFPKARTSLVVLTLAVGTVSLGIGGWIARAGGEVSHSEFRGDEAPPAGVKMQMSNDTMQMTNSMPMTNKMKMSGMGEEKHAAPIDQTAMKTQIPNTLEGIWAELHKHYSALESAVTAKNFDQVHPHAVAIDNLTKGLVDIAHPDHKAVVQSGVDKINHAADDLHKAAHAGDETVIQNNLKQLKESLEQLEQQMKKQ